MNNVKGTSNPDIVSSWLVLDEAHQALRTVVAGVGDAGWDRSTPCSEWNVTQVLQHAAGDQLAWAWSITGESRAADDPFAPSGQLSEAPGALVEAAVAESAAAFGGVPADRQNTPTPLPQGPMTAEGAAGACA
ncbi:MAG: maleylpyruvate isomerase N-terminal domain-containing protein, partial [Nakamurella sp.]